MVNRVFLLGNLGKDPESKEVNGTTMCRFPMATTEHWVDNTQTKRERTEWHNIVVWGNQAKSCQTYLSKGCRVFVEGSIRSRKFEDGDKGTRYITEIRADDVRFITRKERSEAPETSKAYDWDSRLEEQTIPF